LGRCNQADAAGTRAQCDKLQAAMDNVGGDKLKKQKALVKDLAAGITAGQCRLTLSSPS
jgi:structural maintenance of chromosome 4